MEVTKCFWGREFENNLQKSSPFRCLFHPSCFFTRTIRVGNDECATTSNKEERGRCVCEWVRVCVVCVLCVCLCERVRVCVVCVSVWEREWVCVCEREWECVLCVCLYEKESVCCFCVRARKREGVCVCIRPTLIHSLKYWNWKTGRLFYESLFQRQKSLFEKFEDDLNDVTLKNRKFVFLIFFWCDLPHLTVSIICALFSAFKWTIIFNLVFCEAWIRTHIQGLWLESWVLGVHH